MSDKPEPITLGRVMEVAEAARTLAVETGIDFKTAVRRKLGRGDWRHDSERLAAAQAKRERKHARNRRDRRS